MRVDRRKHQRLASVGAEFGIAQGNGSDVLHLSRGPVKLGYFSSSAAIDDIGIEWIGRNVPVLDHAHGMPFAESDGAVVAAAGSAHRTALLLRSTDTIGKT